MDQGDRNLKINNCRNLKERNNPSVLLKKIISIVEHQVTRNDFERQKEKINELLKICSNGFLVADLINVMYLIELLLERIHVCEYVNLLEGILHTCSIPPVLIKSSDVLTFTRDLKEYFSMLGYLLVCLQTEDFKNLVVFVLINLLTKNLPDQRCHLSLDARNEFAKKSRLAEILGHLLELADDNLYPKLLQIIHLLTKDSDEVCKVLVHEDALNSLITRLEPTWRERYPDIKPASQPIDNVSNYEEASNIIWTLLNYLSKDRDNMKNVKNITLFSLWSLQYVYRLFVISTCKALYRNNSLVLIIKLMDLFPKMAVVKSGLAEDLISVSMSPFYTRNSWAAHVRLSVSGDDYTYLQMLLTCVSKYTQFVGGIRLLEDYRVLQKLLKISINSTDLKWPQPQLCLISVATLDVMKKIVPYMEEEFIENAGPTTMLNFLQRYQVNDSDINVLRKCLETLNHILKQNSSNMILNSILFNDGQNVILGVCDNIMSKPINHSMKEKSLGIALCVLTTVYKYSHPMDNTPAIDLAIKYMTKIVNPKPNEPVPDNRVIICLMNFTWEHIIKYEEESLQFVKRKGVFLMLDIIQKFPFVVQLVTLGALVDLCEYGHCIPYLIAWRGNGQKIIPLLMKLFREENKRLKVKYGPCGQILDIKYPLMGKEQWIQTFCRCKELSGSPSCSDLFVSCRPKIYALLQMLNVRHAEIVEIADEHYKSYNDDLEAKDQVTMLLAENFLALKLGETWVEVKTELETTPNALTPIDQQIINNIIDRSLKWASYLQRMQNIFLRDVYHKNLIEEQKLYNYLEASRLSEALQALNDLKYIARSSERLFRVSQKFKRNCQIESSVKSSAVEPDPQKTYLSKICVTPVFNQFINVESKIGRNTEEIVIIPVSPSVSHNECETDVPEDLLQSSTDISCVL